MHFSDTHIIYLAFRLLLFIVALANGIVISRNNGKVTLNSFLPTIIIYTLYAGLRWGRGIDYNLYYWIYQDIINGTGREDNEPLFKLLVQIFGALSLEWQHFVIFMSFFLALSGCFFLKEFRRGMPFLLPMFFMSVTLAENLQRWYLAFSFTFFALGYLFKKDYKKVILFSLSGFLVHYGFILVLVQLYVIWYFSKKPILSPWISFCIYILVFVLFSPDMMGAFANMVQRINIGTRFAGYQANAEAWLTGNANDEVRTELTIGNIIPSVFILFAGYTLTTKNKDNRLFVTMYNWSVWGIIFAPAALQIELLMRICAPFILMRDLFLARLLYEIIIRKSIRNTPIYFLSLFFLLHYFFSKVISYPLKQDKESTYYIWDSKGRKTL